MSLVRTYGGKAGMGALAVVSLFMMLMMVRRVGEGPVLPGEEPPKTRVIRLKGDRGPAAGEEELEPMEVAVPPVGEARQTEQLLVGKEVDERTLRTQQVVDQVSDMVRGDTDAAVSILRRWIDEGKH